jgi:hypothetical protein
MPFAVILYGLDLFFELFRVDCQAVLARALSVHCDYFL